MPNPSVRPFAELRGELARFDAIIDARSTAEYALDHLPGAVNHPTLDDAERAAVGTLHTTDAFAARRMGAAMAARNIARHIEESFAKHPAHWKPLIYCWRGGQRSASLAHVLARVGWQVTLIEGGYKAFRRAVIEDLETLPDRLSFRVLCGATGSGKSRLLAALARAGGQVLDLEALACHRGSVLGGLPDAPQPAQTAFETALWQALQGFDPAQPVWVEAESKHIGRLRVPEHLMTRIRASPCTRVDLPTAARVQLLIEDYAHLIAHPDQLTERLDALVELHGHERLAEWRALTAQGDWEGLVTRLLVEHYDPAYRRSTGKNYLGLATALPLEVSGLDDFDRAARTLLASAADMPPPPERPARPSSETERQA